ncbi:GntR family transcriptional regulator [Virgisporangium aurantiacum]|uniref:GntR family transcriptional regulator n=1 Tax=Virgisporangium aurantiacum TaxID=175570 RepID=A0A8J4E185_9ACTN|nr:GntR family transcriptional regulator [Virgisporangium aurantiacum]GIJ57581.1 GntR family transcriptional regulator [Virgisporangium aurantiacum]
MPQANERVGGPVAIQQRIQELIMSGAFGGGDRLVEEDLAARLDVSRTPVREALHALAARGLVARASRTWTVRKLDVRDVREIYEVRCALECAAARLAALRRSADHVDAIDGANRFSRTVLAGPATDFTPASFTPASERVHGLIVHAANNQRLAQEIEQSQLVYFSRPIAAMYSAPEIEESIAEHEAVARAITDQDPDAADAAMRHHIEHALDHVVRKLAWLT